jgi:hypothetical protein
MCFHEEQGVAALLMAWMPLPTASQCATVMFVETITEGESIHAINKALWDRNSPRMDFGF